MRFGLAIMSLVFSAASMSEETQTEAVLSVKPSLCITDERNASCEMSLSIAWRSESAGTYCLYNDLDPEPVRCWSGQSSGRFEEERVVEASFNYWLADGSDDARVAEASVEVMSTQSDDRRRNRRHRHAWSIL